MRNARRVLATAAAAAVAALALTAATIGGASAAATGFANEDRPRDARDHSVRSLRVAGVGLPNNAGVSGRNLQEEEGAAGNVAKKKAQRAKNKAAANQKKKKNRPGGGGGGKKKKKKNAQQGQKKNAQKKKAQQGKKKKAQQGGGDGVRTKKAQATSKVPQDAVGNDKDLELSDAADDGEVPYRCVVVGFSYTQQELCDLKPCERFGEELRCNGAECLPITSCTSSASPSSPPGGGPQGSMGAPLTEIQSQSETQELMPRSTDFHRCMPLSHEATVDGNFCHVQEPCDPHSAWGGGGCWTNEICSDYTSECANVDPPRVQGGMSPGNPNGDDDEKYWRCTPENAAMTHHDVCVGLGPCRAGSPCPEELESYPGHKVVCLDHPECADGESSGSVMSPQFPSQGPRLPSNQIRGGVMGRPPFFCVEKGKTNQGSDSCDLRRCAPGNDDCGEGWECRYMNECNIAGPKRTVEGGGRGLRYFRALSLSHTL